MKRQTIIIHWGKLVIGVTGVLWIIGCGRPSSRDIYMKGSLEEVQQLAQYEKDIDGADEKGWTPLMLAASQNTNVDVIRYLLAAGAEIKPRNKNGVTPLSAAAAGNANPEVIGALIAAGADVNEADENGMTALMFAAARNANSLVVKVLLANGAAVNMKSCDGSSALLLAAMFNTNPDVAQALIDGGAQVNDQNDLMITPLSIAGDAESGNKNPEVRKVLLRAGAVDYMLYRRCSPAELQQHLQDGAKINAKGMGEITPLMQAVAENPYPQVIQAMLKAGADPNARDDDGRTALMYLGFTFDDPNPEIVKALLAGGADPNLSDNAGKTVMFYVKSKSDAIKSLLTKSGALPDAIDAWHGLVDASNALRGRSHHVSPPYSAGSDEASGRTNCLADKYTAISEYLNDMPVDEIKPEAFCGTTGASASICDAFSKTVKKYLDENEKWTDVEWDTRVKEIRESFSKTVESDAKEEDLPFLLQLLAFQNVELDRSAMGVSTASPDYGKCYIRGVVEKFLRSTDGTTRDDVFGLVLVATSDYFGLESSDILCQICADLGDDRALPTLIDAHQNAIYGGNDLITAIAKLDPTGAKLSGYFAEVEANIREWQGGINTTVPAWGEEARELKELLASTRAQTSTEKNK